MSEPAIIVAGLGRCGSSVTMQMLHAAGVPCVGEPPSFEAEGTNPSDFDYTLFERAAGHAIKILDPHRLPKSLRTANAQTLFCIRGFEEQALSQIKFATTMLGLPTPQRAPRKRWIASLRREEPQALRALPTPAVILSFYEFCRDPRAYAQRLRAALSDRHDLDVERMLSVVRPRKAFEACEPGLDIELACIATQKAQAA